MHQRCTDIIKLNLYGMRSSLFALHLWIHNSGRNCAKLGLSLSKKSILFLRRKFRVFCTKNQLCFGVFDQENHFNWCWAPNGICFMNLSLSGWDFGSEALTRLLTCTSVPDGALYSHHHHHHHQLLVWMILDVYWNQWGTREIRTCKPIFQMSEKPSAKTAIGQGHARGNLGPNECLNMCLQEFVEINPKWHINLSIGKLLLVSACFACEIPVCLLNSPFEHVWKSWSCYLHILLTKSPSHPICLLVKYVFYPWQSASYSWPVMGITGSQFTW